MKTSYPFALVALAALTGPLAAQTATAAAEAATAAEPAPVLVVKPSGLYLDLAEQGSDITSLLMGGGGQPKPFYEFLEQIEGLASSDSDHILFDLTASAQLNGPQLTELNRALQRVKKAGKKTWAYIENIDTNGYRIAAACDHVLIANLGMIDMTSPALSVTFMKDAMDLLGIHTDVLRCGDFKGAAEPYMYPRMSSHLRDHYKAMLEKMNISVVQEIAQNRDLSIAKVRGYQADRLFTADKAIKAGLADQIVPWRGAKHALKLATSNQDLTFESAQKSKKRKNVNFLAMMSQMLNPKSEAEEVEDESIVVLHLAGGIVDGDSPVPGSMVSGPTVATIDGLRKDENVKGVVVRVNSPGGSATASEAILLALRELADTKPVVFSMGRVAGSGGYYITCIGRPILAEATTITGSIGVFSMKMSMGALFRRIGVHDETIALDDSASMMLPNRPWSDSEKERMQGFIDSIYDVFLGHVCRSRSMTTQELLPLAGGRVWSGEQAVANGLVDKIGGVQDAIAMIADNPEDYEIVHLPRPKDFFETIAQQMFSAQLLDNPALQLAATKLNLDHALRLVNDAIENDNPARVWAMMPEAIRFR